jgi:hypothetical protein
MQCEWEDFLLAVSEEEEGSMSPGAERREEDSVEGPLGKSSEAGGGWQLEGKGMMGWKEGGLTDFDAWRGG